MEVFDQVVAGGHEQVVFCHDRSTGLRAIIAVHSTVLGPGLGGTRFHPYPDESAALLDVLRLSRGMTYKNAAAGLDLGGGKAVLIGDPGADRTEALIRAYARFVDSLGGRYLTAEDVGTGQADMDLIHRETPFVTGTSESLGGSGDPSPATAFGVLHAMYAVADHLWGSPSLDGRHVTVAGVGKVGAALVRHLVEVGAKVTVADVDDAKVRAAVDAHGVASAPADRVHSVPCDIHAPCALGAGLNARTIPELACAAVCGSANNQLAEQADAQRMVDAGVLYAPDYVVNAGGVINIAEELRGYDRARAWERITEIRRTTATVLEVAASDGVTTAAAADRLAEARIEAIGAVQRIRTAGRARGGVR